MNQVPLTDAPATLSWTENGTECHALWRSERHAAPPKRVIIADDTLNADSAYRLACEGTGLLWRGDFQNARLLLQAMMRRSNAPIKPGKVRAKSKANADAPVTPQQAFHLHRQAQSQRARTLSMLLIPLNADRSIPLRRAPDLAQACAEAWGPATQANTVTSLRELLGVVGAHEWHKKGIEVEALGGAPNNKIFPSYGVFSPVRGEYVALVASAPLPVDYALAFDIGVGSGVLSAMLSRRGVKRIVATDNDPRAILCARGNLDRLGALPKVQLIQTDLFPEGQAPLIVCNPPWLPARANAPIEHAIYDENSQMLRGFLNGVLAHLTPQGQAWLILSDLAEHLGLRSREALLGWIEQAGLQVLGREDIRPTHAKAMDKQDPLHAARSKEVTSLWRLGALTAP
ncbi:class I SAM-dependent methyltransferase [Limnohabitans sp. Rim8]|uniref:class I SAM-dependent methyltransferase n=1 Tax=Limnohabitans sp. Rim8 TaxID=1100718 RepID=UPI0033061086